MVIKFLERNSVQFSYNSCFYIDIKSFTLEFKYNFDRHGKELSGVLMASTSRTKHTESIKMCTFFNVECRFSFNFHKNAPDFVT